MTISFIRYVDITSGVGGGVAVRRRDLILRLFTTSPLVPLGSVVEATSADDVATLFGSGSAEHLRARAYFGFVSKSTTRPKKISFGRYVPAATGAQIFGIVGTYLSSSFTGVTAGSLNLTLGSYTSDVTGMNFTGVTTLSQVASTLQTAIRAVSAGGVAWTGATVVFNSTTQRFELTAGTTGAQPVAVAAAASGTPIATLLGWVPPAIFSPGAALQTPDAALAASVGVSDNFGSFAFIPTLNTSQIIAVAQQNDTYNVKFRYDVPVPDLATGTTLYAALSGVSGVTLTYAPLATEYPELLPAKVEAATDYTRRNSVQNYMFQLDSLTPSVTDDATANSLDAIRVNYYGRTQSAGQFLDFYQRGVMCGLATDPVDINVYANEAWFKDAAGATIMSLLLSMPTVGADEAGKAAILGVLQSVIAEARNNGVISIGKDLTTVQKIYITERTDDPNAWQQVRRLGYWLGLTFQEVTTQDSRTEYRAVYELIYSKADAIRSVQGTHTLI